MILVLVLVWSGLLVRVCWLVLLSSVGATTLVLCGTHHPLWLSFRLICWFGLWLGFGLSSGDIFVLWQHHEAIILGRVVSQSILLVNELIFVSGL
jgi:hypothetical protein